MTSRPPARPRACFSRGAFVALAGLSALTFVPRFARAQACCAGGSTVTPGRLAMHEDAVVGLLTRSTFFYGSYATTGDYRSQPADTNELGFEQNVFGTLRILGSVQATLAIPFVSTYRKNGADSEFGGGIGDTSIGLRYDPLVMRERDGVPGVGFLFGMSLPTGRPAEDARSALATDATGIGAFETNVGVNVEHAIHNFYFGLVAVAGARAPRRFQGITQTLGPRLTWIGAAGYVFESGAALLAQGSFSHEFDPITDGRLDSGLGRRSTQVGFSGVIPFGMNWRLLANASVQPPLSGVGQSQPAGATLGLTLIRGFSP